MTVKTYAWKGVYYFIFSPPSDSCDCLRESVNHWAEEDCGSSSGHQELLIRSNIEKSAPVVWLPSDCCQDIVRLEERMLTALTRQEAATEAARSERKGEGKKETISGVQGETVTLRCRSVPAKLRTSEIFFKDSGKKYPFPETGQTSGGPWSRRTRRGSRRLSRTCPGSSASSWVPTRWAPTGASPAPRSCTPSPSPWRTRLVILVAED